MLLQCIFTKRLQSLLTGTVAGLHHGDLAQGYPPAVIQAGLVASRPLPKLIVGNSYATQWLVQVSPARPGPAVWCQ